MAGMAAGEAAVRQAIDTKHAKVPKSNAELEVKEEEEEKAMGEAREMEADGDIECSQVSVKRSFLRDMGDEFVCSICCDLMVLAHTLDCSHSYVSPFPGDPASALLIPCKDHRPAPPLACNRNLFFFFFSFFSSHPPPPSPSVPPLPPPPRPPNTASHLSCCGARKTAPRPRCHCCL